MKNEKAKIIELVKQYGRIQSVMGFVNEDTLKKSYHRLMDKGTEEIGMEYGKNLDENINKLHERMLKFSYYPQSKCRSCVSNTDAQNHRHEVRTFEDEIVQSTFKDILDAIYEPKIEERLSKRKRSELNKEKRHIKIFATSFLGIRVKSIVGNIDKEHLITFLNQDIADKKFVRYIRRFLECKTNDLKNQTNLEAKSSMLDLYMLNSVWIYYILQNLDVIGDYQLKGVMWIRWTEEEINYMFTNQNDAKVIYKRLLRRLKGSAFNMSESQNCISQFFMGQLRYIRKARKH